MTPYLTVPSMTLIADVDMEKEKSRSDIMTADECMLGMQASLPVRTECDIGKAHNGKAE